MATQLESKIRAHLYNTGYERGLKAGKESFMKPGYKTTEFWLALSAVVVSAAMGSGAVPDDSGLAKVLALVASALAALGYAGARAWTKGKEIESETLKAISPLKKK